MNSPTTAPSSFLTPREAAEYLRLSSVRALYQAVRRGAVRARRMGRRMLFSRADLDAAVRPARA